MPSPGARNRALLRPQEVVAVTRSAVRAFGVHRTQRMAAALAYYTLFSLFPILLLLLALIGYLLDADWYLAVETRAHLVRLTADMLPAAGNLVNSAIGSIQAARGASGVIGLLGLLWSASTTFNQLHIALDQIWGLNGLPGLRLTVRRRAVSLVMVLGLGLVLIAAQVLDSISRSLPAMAKQVPEGALVLSVVTRPLPIIVAIVAFGLLYRALPSVPISWRDVWAGAVLAGIGWESLKWLFALYAARFANWQAVYGPVAGVVGLLTWLYLSFVVILFGAEFAFAYSTRPRRWSPAAAAVPEPADPSPQTGEGQVPEPTPSSPNHRRRRGAAFVRGTAAGVIGVVAALVIGIGLLVGNARRLGRSSTEQPS